MVNKNKDEKLTSKIDYYSVLGVATNDSNEEIKEAFTKLVKNKGLNSTFNNTLEEINEAYSVLSNAESRSKYDQFGLASPDLNNIIFDGFGAANNACFSQFTTFSSEQEKNRLYNNVMQNYTGHFYSYVMWSVLR